MSRIATRLTLMVGAITFAASTAAAAVAPAQPVVYSPWVALSAFASPSSSAALCGTDRAGSEAGKASQERERGCILPPIEGAGGTASIGATGPIATAAGLGTFPLLVGLAALAGFAALALGSGDGASGDAIGARPLSPP
jgi:hypothetical protein